MPNRPWLSESAWKILEALARVVLTEPAVREFPLETIDFKPSVARGIARLPAAMRFFLGLSLHFIQWLSVLRFGRPFTRLTAERQDRYFKGWFHSRSYLSYLILRPLLVFIYSAYYSHPRVAGSLGFQENAGPAKRAPLRVNGVLEAPSQTTEIEVEVCVIGSGAGGAVIAKELAERGHDVLILEEGDYYSREYFKTAPTLERNGAIYREGGLYTTLGVPMILLPTGKSVGGTTLINSGTCFRTPTAVLDQWRKEFGLSSVTAASLEPYFEKVERTLHIEPVSEELLGRNNRIIRRGVDKLGLHGQPLLRNAAGCKGSGLCIFGCPEGAKQSVETSYLPLAFTAGARLYPNCHVERLVRRGGRVVQVKARFTDPATGRKTASLTVRPKRVVVAGGTLESPLLLQRSGIARGSRALGRNLSIHPTVKVMGIFDEIVDGFKGVPQAYSVTDYESEGIMFESVFFPPWLLATSMFEAQEKHREIMKAYRHIGIFGFLVHDDSRGRVIAGPGGRPLALYNLGNKEKGLFVKGLKVLTQIFFAAGAKVVYPTVRSLPEIRSYSEIEGLTPEGLRRRDIESAAFHPLGTCRMGSDPKDSVVDEFSRVHELENLWVADGSIFPSSLGVNPQVTIMAFAARCADRIHESLRASA